MTTTAGDKARRAGDSEPLELSARAGFIAYGIVHLLIGWLALQIAWRGPAAGEADPAGALKTVARQPLGEVLLYLIAAGLLALAVWQVSEVVWGQRHREGAERLRGQAINGARALIYAALAYTSASVALGSRTSGAQSQREATTGVLGWPGGRVLIVVAGLIIVAIGAAHVVKALKRSFLDDFDTGSMSREAREAIARVGQIGYLAKGVALAMVGGLLAYATATFDRQRSGLDGAMQTIADQPYGKLLLTAVAIGFAAYGVFAILRSRYRRM